MKKIEENYNILNDVAKEYILVKKIDSDIKSFNNQNNEIISNTNNIKIKKTNTLNVTQVEILKLANTAEITARDVMQKFNITREHASRLLSYLSSQGYLKRVNESKPYKYIIGEKGKEYLSD